MTNKYIRNIIFDLGGVLYEIEYEETFRRLSEIMGMDLRVGSWPEDFKEAVFSYEVGQLSTESFLNRLQRMSAKNIQDPRLLIDAWNAMLIGWFPDVFSFLEELSQTYQLFLLSNISELHIRELEKSLADQGGRNYLGEYFEQVYFSNEIGMRKPNVKAFKLILDNHQLVPEETLFVDDYKKNISGAKAIGINGMFHQNGRTLKNKLKKQKIFVC